MYLNSLLADYAFDVAEPIARRVTVGVLAALLLVGLVLFFVKRKFVGKYAKFASIGAVFFALALGVIMLSLQLAKYTDEGYLSENGVNRADVIPYVVLPILILFAAALVAGILLFTLSVLDFKKAFKLLAIVFGVLLAAGLVAVFILIAVYYSRNIAEDGYFNSDTASVNQVVLYISSAALVLLAVGGAFGLGGKDKTPIDSRCIALAGICIAMSFALSYIKLWEMPQGGSVTLASLLPLMIFAYIYGPKKGVLAGFVYGVLQAVQGASFIIHPAVFLLDYFVAFSFIGFTGVFSGMHAIKLPQVRFALGAVAASVLRFISHVLSGVFAFSAYAGETNVWAYSLAYNSFVFVDLALVIVAGVFVFSSKAFMRETAKYNPSLSQ